jgi:predicted nucleic acid-binding protein
MIAVIDTSALLRLIIPDGPVPHGLEAFLQAAERGEHTAVAPDLMWVEAANVLNKKRRQGLLNKEETEQALGLVLRMPIKAVAHREYLPAALQLAERYELTVYDALYLAITRVKGARLYTADDRLEKAAAGNIRAP